MFLPENIDTELYRLLVSRMVQEVIPQDIHNLNNASSLSSAYSVPNM